MDGANVGVVEGEALALVVAGGAEALVLLDDPRAILPPPLPDALDERLSPELVAVDALGPQLLLDHRLGGDPGVVGAEDPERVPPPHPVEAGQRVLDRAVERVPHVEGAGDVRRRDRDRVVLAGRTGRLGVEVAALEPAVEDPRLDLSRLVAGAFLEPSAKG